MKKTDEPENKKKIIQFYCLLEINKEIHSTNGIKQKKKQSQHLRLEI